VRREFRAVAAKAGIRPRFAPHQLRHAHALELAREGVPLNIIQRQLGHANPGTTSIYLQGIDPEEILAAARARPPPQAGAPRRSRFPRTKQASVRPGRVLARIVPSGHELCADRARFAAAFPVVCWTAERLARQLPAGGTERRARRHGDCSAAQARAETAIRS
jgi:hypothetical protein